MHTAQRVLGALTLILSLLVFRAHPASAQDLGVTDVRAALGHSIEAGRATALLLSEQLASASAAERLAGTSGAYRLLLTAVHGHARALRSAGEMRRAAAVALGFLANPPVDAGAGETLPAEHYYLFPPECSECLEYSAQRVTALIPADRRTTGMLNDLAFYLVDAPIGAWEDADELVALSILTQIVQLRPQRRAAVLNLADLLWNRQRYEEAQPIYRRFLTARGDRAPARVRERIAGVPAAQETPRRPRFGPEPTITQPDEYSYEARASLGTIQGGEVSYISRSSESMDETARLSLIWTRGEERIETVAGGGDDGEGGTGGGPSPYEVALRGGLVEVHYGTAGFSTAGSTVVDRWRLNRGQRRFVRVSREEERVAQRLHDAQAELTRVLRVGEDFEQARGLILSVGPYGETMHEQVGPEMRRAFFSARLRVAASWPRRRRAAVAHAMVIELIALLRDRENDVDADEIYRATHRANQWAGASARSDILTLLQNFEYTADDPRLAALRVRLLPGE